MRILLLIFILLIPMNAYAYIGPGMGLGAIGVVFGVLFSIFLALVSIIWYPFKRLLKKIKKMRKLHSIDDSDPS